MSKTEFFKKAVDNLYNTYGNGFGSKPLDYCNASIIFNDNYIALQSYKTIVAVIDRTKKIMIIDGWYSTTTSKHISKFITKYPNTIKIWAYLRSDKIAVEEYNKIIERYNKKTYADAFITDFESIISKYI